MEQRADSEKPASRTRTEPNHIQEGHILPGGERQGHDAVCSVHTDTCVHAAARPEHRLASDVKKWVMDHKCRSAVWRSGRPPHIRPALISTTHMYVVNKASVSGTLVCDAFKDTWPLPSADQLTLALVLFNSIKNCEGRSDSTLVSNVLVRGTPVTPSHTHTHTKTHTQTPQNKGGQTVRGKQKNKPRRGKKKKMQWENLSCVRSSWCVRCVCVCVYDNSGLFILFGNFAVNQLFPESQGGKPILRWIVSPHSLKASFVENTCFTSVLLDGWQKSWILSGNDTTYGITWPNLQERATSQQQLLLRTLWEFPRWQTSFPLCVGS